MSKYCMTEHKLLTEKYLLDRGFKIQSQKIGNNNIVYFALDKKGRPYRFAFNQFEAIQNAGNVSYLISEDFRNYILEREPNYKEPLINYLRGKLNSLRAEMTVKLADETYEQYKKRRENTTKIIKSISAKLCSLIGDGNTTYRTTF